LSVEPGDNQTSPQPDDSASVPGSAAVADTIIPNDGPPPERFTVTVSDDHLHAWIQLISSDDTRPVEASAVIAALEKVQIVKTRGLESRVQAFIEAIKDEGKRSEGFLIAEGRPAVESKNGEFIWDESLKTAHTEWQEDAQIDYYTFNSFVTVGEGATIGKIVPPAQGEDGVDVHGQILKPKRRPTEVEVGSDLLVSEDGSGAVVAEAAGKITYRLERLTIDKVLDIRGDVDFESGSVDSSIDVSIKGSILDGFTVKSERTITVGARIGAATVEAKSDVIVRGGILGRGKGTVKAGGDIVAKFAEEATLEADGDIVIGKELMNSDVRCHRQVLASHGDVIGGRTFARDGIEMGKVGSDADIRTEIMVGVHPDVYAEAASIETPIGAKRALADKIRAAVGPLMANLKRLLPAQKKRATELMFQAGTAETEISEAEQRRDELIEVAKAEGEPFVIVSKTIHPGVSIRIDRKETVFKRELKGPVRIERRKVRSATEFVAVNQLTGSVTVLPSAEAVEQSPKEREEHQA